MLAVSAVDVVDVVVDVVDDVVVVSIDVAELVDGAAVVVSGGGWYGMMLITNVHGTASLPDVSFAVAVMV